MRWLCSWVLAKHSLPVFARVSIFDPWMVILNNLWLDLLICKVLKGTWVLELLLGEILERQNRLFVCIQRFFLELNLRNDCRTHINRNIDDTQVGTHSAFWASRGDFWKHLLGIIFLQGWILARANIFLPINADLVNKCVFALIHVDHLFHNVLIHLWPMNGQLISKLSTL